MPPVVLDPYWFLFLGLLLKSQLIGVGVRPHHSTDLEDAPSFIPVTRCSVPWNVIYDLYICNQQHHPAEIGKKRYVMRTFKERTRIVEVHWPYQCHVFSLFRVILTYGLGAQ